MPPPSVIAITGATGFTGPFVVRALREQFPHAQLRAVIRASSDPSRISADSNAIVVAYLRDGAALRRALENADTLVNVASLGFDWVSTIVTAAESAGIRRAIFIGTTAMLTTLPVASKAVREQGERVVMDSGLDWTILRPTMIYGTPKDRNIARLVNFVRRSPIVPIVAPHALQQPVHVEDVAQAVAKALDCPVTIRRAYNISGKAPLSLRSLVAEVALALGRRRAIVVLPLAAVVGLVNLLQRVVQLPVKPEQVRRIAEDKSFAHDEAARDFGFSPRSFRDGLRSEVALCTPNH
jgi:uncharacterized protein YbjT (DUF2867 family)